ncbi:MAG: aminodeoxychorismate synthase component I [Thermodesulfobacteriota bacterium]
MRPPRPLNDEQLAGLLHFVAAAEKAVWLETSRPGSGDHRSLLFSAPVAILTCTTQNPPALFFKAAEEHLNQGYHLAGWFAYEFGYLLEPVLSRLLPEGATPLAVLGVFPPPLIFDHASATWNRTPPWSAPAEGAATEGYTLTSLRFSESAERYRANLERIKEYIAAGDTYQVNYTLKLLFDFAGSPAALYTALRRNQSVAYSAWLKLGEEQILSFSPELFFRKEGDRCTVRPMKGTSRRGVTPEEDALRAASLRHDAKNRSENVMIVDLLRNDLGRLCRQGTVRARSLFDIETYETLHQMTSTIEGELRPGLGLAELFQGLFPCGSVTGAPKIRTMEIIRELEGGPRGVYTGAIGYLAPDGSALFSVPIRTVVLRGNGGEMGIGSGVVNDSDPEREWRECQLKGRFLSQPTPPFELIETMAWLPGEGYWLLDLHLARLLGSATLLGFQTDEATIRGELEALDQTLGGSQRVRLTLRKDGTMRLSQGPCEPPRRDLAAALATGEAATLPQVVFSPQGTDSREPLRYHKTSRREFYDAERARAVAAGFYEVLFVNERNEVTEGAITTLFVRRSGALLTPPLACGLLPGVFRRHLLATSPLPVVETVLTMDDLRHAEALYVGNSVRGLVPVRLADPPVLAALPASAPGS